MTVSTNPTRTGMKGDVVDVLSFGADKSGVSDSTAAFTAAQGAGNCRVRMPAGTYKLNNLRVKTGVVFEGDGYNSTFIQQANTDNPAIYALSDVTVGQLINIGITKCRVIGLESAGASAVKVEATTPYVVAYSDFDYHAYDVSTALEIVVAAANEVYSNKFNVVAVGCAGTAFITEGAYNEYTLRATERATGFTLSDTSSNSTFHACVGLNSA